jgi:hypothetical protein
VYNWDWTGYGGNPDPGKCGLIYLPMIHGLAQAAAASSGLANGNGRFLLGYNEWAFSLARPIIVDMLLDPNSRQPQST